MAVIWRLLLDSPCRQVYYLFLFQVLDFRCTCYTHWLCSYNNPPQPVLFHSSDPKIHHGLSFENVAQGNAQKALNAFQLSVFKGCLRRGASLFWIQSSISVCLCLHCWEEERWQMRVQKRGKGKMKREGGCVTCYCMCYTKMILHRDGRRHLSEAVKVPMNHTALSLFLFLSLSFYVLLSLSIFLSLPLGLGLSARVSLFSLFVSPLSHVPVSEHYQLHGMCRRAMKCICHCFHIYTLFLPHAVFISHCVPTPVSVTRCAPASLLGLITSVDVLKNTSSGRSNKRHVRSAHSLSLIIWYLLV